jgi:hypothetical protein
MAELQSLLGILFLEMVQKQHFVRQQSSLCFLIAFCEHSQDSLLFGMTNCELSICHLCTAGRPVAVGRSLLF